MKIRGDYMEIYAQNGKKRPARLSEQTRKFAYESLNRKYGLDTLSTPAILFDDVENFDTLSNLEKYDIAIKKIVFVRFVVLPRMKNMVEEFCTQIF